MTIETLDRPTTMFGGVIRLLHGDRPLESDRQLYEAAIAIRDEMPALTRFEGFEVDTLLAYGVHASNNLPSLSQDAWSRIQSPYSIRHNPMKGVEGNVAAICRRIDERLADFRAARLASEDGTAVARLRQMMEEQKELHPRLGLSFGYIGNCDFSGRWDDRSWKIFTRLATPSCVGACDVSFGGVSTARLGQLMQSAERDFPDWCNKQEERLDKGEIRIVR